MIQTPVQKLSRNSFYKVLNISYFSHFTSNISGQLSVGLEAALAWTTCTFSLAKKLSFRQFHSEKHYRTMLRSLEAFQFQLNRDNSGNLIDLIFVGKCPQSVIRL